LTFIRRTRAIAGGLGLVELASDELHHSVIQTFGLRYEPEGIAGERLLGEYIDEIEGQGGGQGSFSRSR